MAYNLYLNFVVISCKSLETFNMIYTYREQIKDLKIKRKLNHTKPIKISR